MSIAQETKVRELEERVSKLEQEKQEPIDLSKLWGEIKTIKMRMARDGKRTSSPD